MESHLEDLGTPVLEDEAEPGDGRRALACKMTKEELEALVREYEGIIRIILEADREWFALSPDQNEELHKRLRGSTYEIALRIDERRRQELEEARRREEEEALRREEDQLREQQAREEREVQRQQDQQAFQTKVWAALGQLGEEAEKS
ncbi:MAG: hypothetical protein Q4A34_01735 [Candidatus Saccharibacteria bacterium]|nr:hypothetical protein [Candidatus Saccharibacteria bacterium]